MYIKIHNFTDEILISLLQTYQTLENAGHYLIGDLYCVLRD